MGQDAEDADQEAIDSIADWSDWTPFRTGVLVAPRLPGVYLIREPRSRRVLYVGMAGERNGSGRPQGLWGRLSIYRRGKGAVSGFGEAVLDRALANEEFVARRLESLKKGNPQRAKDWAIAAIEWLDPELRWAVCSDGASALALETQIEDLLGTHGLWNRTSMKRAAHHPTANES